MSTSDPTGIPSDEELSSLEADLDKVDDALARLDAGDLDGAEAVTDSLESTEEPTDASDAPVEIVIAVSEPDPET